MLTLHRYFYLISLLSIYFLLLEAIVLLDDHYFLFFFFEGKYFLKRQFMKLHQIMLPLGIFFLISLFLNIQSIVDFTSTRNKNIS